MCVYIAIYVAKKEATLIIRTYHLKVMIMVESPLTTPQKVSGGRRWAVSKSCCLWRFFNNMSWHMCMTCLLQLEPPLGIVVVNNCCTTCGLL